MERYSKQREMIYHYLLTHKTHPTADDIYQDLVKEYPALSLGTVYRNLNILCSTGKIRKVEVDNTIHYDGDISDHYHFVCNRCHEITDVFPMKSFQYDDIDGYHIDYVDVVYHGMCNSCISRNFE